MKKEIRQQKLKRFRDEYLPQIENMFYVEQHGPHTAPATMYKIIINDILNFDYYPMSEKVRKNENMGGKWLYKWGQYDVNSLMDNINKIYQIKSQLHSRQ